MLVGKVISLSKEKGFGFIQPGEGGDDLFFHHSTFEGDFDGLQIGEQVHYEVDATAEKPRARKVARLDPASAGSARRMEQRGANSPEDQHRRAGFFDHAELGFVTKLRRREKLGFISADGGGPELLFGAENVSGTRAFGQLAVGDSVRFVRSVNDDADPPVATAVQYTERRQKKADLGLPANPRARRKKPTWRR